MGLGTGRRYWVSVMVLANLVGLDKFAILGDLASFFLSNFEAFWSLLFVNLGGFRNITIFG